MDWDWLQVASVSKHCKFDTSIIDSPQAAIGAPEEHSIQTYV